MQQKALMFYKKSYIEIFVELETAAKQGDLQAFIDFKVVSTQDEFCYVLKHNALYFSILAIVNSQFKILEFIYANSNELIQKEILKGICLKTNTQTILEAAAQGNMEILDFLIESYIALTGKQKLNKLLIVGALYYSLCRSQFQVWSYFKNLLPEKDWSQHVEDSVKLFVSRLDDISVSWKEQLEKMRTLLVFAHFAKFELKENCLDLLLKNRRLLIIAARHGYLEWIKFVQLHGDKNWLSKELMSYNFEILIEAIDRRNFHIAEWIIGQIEFKKLKEFSEGFRKCKDFYSGYYLGANSRRLERYGEPECVFMVQEQRKKIADVANLDKLDDFNLKLNELLHNKLAVSLTLLCGKFIQSTSIQCINDVVTNVVSAEVNLNNMESVVMHIIETYRECKARGEKVDPQSFAFAQKVRESGFLSERG